MLAVVGRYLAYWRASTTSNSCRPRTRFELTEILSCPELFFGVVSVLVGRVLRSRIPFASQRRGTRYRCGKSSLSHARLRLNFTEKRARAVPAGIPTLTNVSIHRRPLATRVNVHATPGNLGNTLMKRFGSEAFHKVFWGITDDLDQVFIQNSGFICCGIRRSLSGPVLELGFPA